MTAPHGHEQPQGRQKRVRRHAELFGEHGEGDFERARVRGRSLEPSRRAAAKPLPHENAEIEAARVDQQSFEDVPMPAQVAAAHAAGVVHVSKGSFDVLSAATQEPLAAHPAHAPSIAVDGSLRLRRVRRRQQANVRPAPPGGAAPGGWSPSDLKALANLSAAACERTPPYPGLEVASLSPAM